MMKIKVVESTMVKPISATPTTTMWLSNLDLINPPKLHVRTLYFYGSNDNFDAALLKAALSRALVEFYPIAGRLKRSENNNRIEIDCNDEGVLFVEAEADGDLDDLGQDFTPRADVTLIPHVDYSKGISSYPIFLVQITRFKCGGICLGNAIHHIVVDGVSAKHFMNTWSDIARGGGALIPPPFLDRTVLRARDPPEPKFAHIEYRIPFDERNDSDLIFPQPKFSVFKLTRDQLNALKTKCTEDGTKYSTFEVLAGHIWRCVSVARGLPEDQESRLIIPVDGRSRLEPPLPQGYIGNAVFTALAVASCGELGSNPIKYAAEKVRGSLVRLDKEYMRSAIDYLEVQEDLKTDARGGNHFRSPNLGILSWARLPMYDADFGWGKPIYVGPGVIPPEEVVIILPSPLSDGGLRCAISLVEEHMNIFEKLFLYHI